jgi:GNAT superfamily N-acetyltransferase
MESDVEVRRAESQDVAAIAGIIRDLGWFAHVNAESFEATLERTAHHLELCGADRSHSVYVAEIDGEVKGYSAVHWCPYLLFTGPEGYVSELFVSESARGQGIGTMLLDAIEQEARSRGCSRLGLLNRRSRESYQRKFYEKRGWVEREEFASFVLMLAP